MATTTTMHRQPFGELNSSRMQRLLSQKNCQNAVTDVLTSKPTYKHSLLKSFTTKRAASLAFEDEDFDSENVDPSNTISAKRGMKYDGTKRPMFKPATKASSTPLTIQTSMPSSTKTATPASSLGHKSPTTMPRSLSSTTTLVLTKPSTTITAPAGRSPKHKQIRTLTKQRGSISPFRRVDPPACHLKPSVATTHGVSFSIDAALNGTLPQTPRMPKTFKHKSAPTPTLSKPQPKSWLFDIHEDTPEQHATNMMEHSACTLDISSDDEASKSWDRTKDDRGKENIPPPDHVAIHLPASAVNVSNNTARRAGLSVVTKEASMIDAPVRSPLGALKAEDYYGAGLYKNSVQSINGGTESDDAVYNGADADDEKENDENAPPAFVVAEDKVEKSI